MTAAIQKAADVILPDAAAGKKAAAAMLATDAMNQKAVSGGAMVRRGAGFGKQQGSKDTPLHETARQMARGGPPSHPIASPAAGQGETVFNSAAV